jgi:hypothetical protein
MPRTSNITAQLQRLLNQANRMKQQAVRGMLKTLKKIEEEKAKRTADLEQAARIIRGELQELGWKANGATSGKRKVAAKQQGRGKRRVRRTPEQLRAEAARVLAMIRGAGKDGIGGADIRKKFPGVGQNIKGFVQQYTGERVRTTGQKVTMKYHAS